ncbi:MAG: O-antigen ligase family protein, partial [Candidatus Aminicenantaceae bacterium]
GLLFYYVVVGLAVSFFSPAQTVALYWGGLYLSPVLVIWMGMKKDDSLETIKRVIRINYVVCGGILLILLPGALEYGMPGTYRLMFYELPFGLGLIRSNGVARFALVILIISVVRFILSRNMKKYAWAVPAAFSVYLFYQTQSRTALLGLAVAGVLLVHMLGLRWQFLFLIPAASYVLYRVGFRERAHERFDELVSLTGREFTWEQAIAQVKQSPFLGWGFHADRILLESQHIHNSYLHALMHGGIIGLAFFAAAVVSVWAVLLKNRILVRIRSGELARDVVLIESVLILGFLTARSFFESTAAFYGVDLLLFVPAAAYVYLYSLQPQSVKRSEWKMENGE